MVTRQDLQNNFTYDPLAEGTSDQQYGVYLENKVLVQQGQLDGYKTAFLTGALTPREDEDES